MTVSDARGQGGPNARSAAPAMGGSGSFSTIPTAAFGKYNLIGKLGHGGMAEVFLAYVSGPAGFCKLAVVKILHEHLLEEPGFLEMFLDEARLAARLNHPNVVQSYEVGDVDGVRFIAMEYLEGQALDRIQRRCTKLERQLPPTLIARIMCEALQGLQYAHELRDFDGAHLAVVHRDVSPHNVFVTYDGAVKLLDFGIAKASTHVVETRTGVVRGKYAYMAPEQARGQVNIDARADLWSMGVVLWESLAGQRLFKGPNELATLNESLMGAIPNLADVAPHTPPSLLAVVDGALQRQPERRYQGAQEMRADLEQYLATQASGTSRSDVAHEMKQLFADAIKRHREILQSGLGVGPGASACIPDAPASAGDPTPSGVRVRQVYRPGSFVTASAVGQSLVSLEAEADELSGSASHPGRSGLTPSADSSPSSLGGASSTGSVGPPSSSSIAERSAGSRAWTVPFLVVLCCLLVLAVAALVLNGSARSRSGTGAGARGAPPTSSPRSPGSELGPGRDRGGPTPEEPEAARAPVEEASLATVHDPDQGAPARGDGPANGGPESPASQSECVLGANLVGITPLPAPLGRPTPSRPSRPRRPSSTGVTNTSGQPPTGGAGDEAELFTSSSGDPTEPGAGAEHGFLTIDTVPWSQVSANGRVLGNTPVIRARLPVGSQELTLLNPEMDIRTTYRINIESGQTVTRRLGLR